MNHRVLLSAAAIAALAACSGAPDAEVDENSKAEETESTTDEAKASDKTDNKSEQAAGAAEKPTKVSTELTCSNPVKADDTGKTLVERYGKDAKVEMLSGPEGTQVAGVVLWDGDPKRVIEVGFFDDARTELGFVRFFEGSDWTLAELETGDTLERVIDINNKPIKFYGFEWDYGGGVTDLGGGALDSIGSCSVGMRLAYDIEGGSLIPNSLIGDREVSSTEPEVDKAHILVNELSIGFPVK
ncbi:MAG: hypothetical protein ABJP70_08345 [Erythrobacter sp.]